MDINWDFRINPSGILYEYSYEAPFYLDPKVIISDFSILLDVSS